MYKDLPQCLSHDSYVLILVTTHFILYSAFFSLVHISYLASPTSFLDTVLFSQVICIPFSLPMLTGMGDIILLITNNTHYSLLFSIMGSCLDTICVPHVQKWIVEECAEGTWVPFDRKN